jgi:hypothetical protein
MLAVGLALRPTSRLAVLKVSAVRAIVVADGSHALPGTLSLEDELLQLDARRKGMGGAILVPEEADLTSA